MLGNFSCFWCRLLTFFKIKIFKKLFQEHNQSVKQFGSISGPTFCKSLSGSKLFAKVIGRRHKSLLARKELITLCVVHYILSYDVASGSEITPCIKIDKPLVVYIFRETL